MNKFDILSELKNRITTVNNMVSEKQTELASNLTEHGKLTVMLGGTKAMLVTKNVVFLLFIAGVSVAGGLYSFIIIMISLGFSEILFTLTDKYLNNSYLSVSTLNLINDYLRLSDEIKECEKNGEEISASHHILLTRLSELNNDLEKLEREILQDRTATFDELAYYSEISLDNNLENDQARVRKPRSKK